MARNTWHILTDETGLTLARHMPVRIDVFAQARFPLCNQLRLAQQIRQDMWRLFQRVRGFSPVVRVERTSVGLLVTAGGRVPMSSRSSMLVERLNGLLHDPSRRARWVDWASRGRAV